MNKIKELDEKYPDRKHYHRKGFGYYFGFRKDYDIKYYSGVGCMMECEKCKERVALSPIYVENIEEFDKHEPVVNKNQGHKCSG